MDARFQGVLAGSMLLHLLLFAALFALPAGTPNPDLVRVYRINVVEAPARPKVRRIELSTKTISALKLESPTLSVEAPPENPESSTAPEAPLLENVPPALTEPMPPQPQATVPVAPKAPGDAPPLSKLPQQNIARPVAPPVRPRSGEEPPPALEPERKPLSTMDKTRKIAEEIKQSAAGELAASKPPANRTPDPGAPRASSPISLRAYRSQVQEEVDKKYTFPGGFQKDLWIRVRLTIARDGSIRKMQIMVPSGNEHFDRAALLSLRRTKLPPIPAGIEGETITQVIVFKP